MQTKIRSTGDSAAPYDFAASEGFAAWLHEQQLGLALTTYQIGKLFLVGAAAPGELTVTERTFERCLGVSTHDNGLLLAGRDSIVRFENVVPRGKEIEGHDAVYVPQVSWSTGDVFAHDVAPAASGRPVFVNTMFSCLATVDERTSFRSVWQPPFVSRLTPEDRCHLNGLAMEDGRPRYVTAAGATDSAEGWRAGRVGGGVVVDVQANAVIATGLTMPHSPRLHEGRLFLHNAGTGELGIVETATGRFEPVAFCPGFLRGLAFHGRLALVGLSLPRQNRTFSGLPLDDRLKQAGQQPECALQVIDLDSGRMLHWLRIGGQVREFYDIACLPGVRHPMVVGKSGPQISRMITRGADLPLDRI